MINVLGSLPKTAILQNVANVSRRFSTPVKTVVTVTPRAADHLIQLMRSAEGEIQGVNLSVKRKGCNGLGYVMNYQTESPKRFDEKVEFIGSKSEKGQLIVDAGSLMHLIGTEIDYQVTEMGSEFTFSNPNKKSSCGCGESFNV